MMLKIIASWVGVFFDGLSFIFENMWTPIHWNKLGRRIFLLTFPISVPLWVLFILVSCFVVMVLFVIIMPIVELIEFAKKLWYGVDMS